MRSPEEYYERYLKGKTKKQIKERMNRLRVDIENVKREIEHSHFTFEIEDESRMRQKLEYLGLYLEKAKRALEDMGEVYKPTQKDKKRASFINNLNDLKLVKYEKIIEEDEPIDFGFYDRYITIYEAKIIDDKVILKTTEVAEAFYDSFENTKEKEMEKEEFIRCLKQLDIGDWQKKYNSKRFGIDNSGEIDWMVTFDYHHNKIIYSGINDHPYNFYEFLALFEEKQIDSAILESILLFKRY